jgi:hypothetical protein
VIKHIVLSLLLFSGIFLYSCSDDPSSVGIRLLDQDLPKIDSINSMDAAFIQTSSYFKKVESLGNSSRDYWLELKMILLLTHYLPWISDCQIQLKQILRRQYYNRSALVEFIQIIFMLKIALLNSILRFTKFLSAWSTSTFLLIHSVLYNLTADDLSSNKNFRFSLFISIYHWNLRENLIDFALISGFNSELWYSYITNTKFTKNFRL